MESRRKPRNLLKSNLLSSALVLSISCAHEYRAVNPSISNPNSEQTQNQPRPNNTPSHCGLRGRSFWYNYSGGQDHIIDNMVPEGNSILRVLCHQKFAALITPSTIYNIPFVGSSATFFETSVSPPLSNSFDFAVSAHSLVALDIDETTHQGHLYVFSTDPQNPFSNFTCTPSSRTFMPQTRVGLIPTSDRGADQYVVLAPMQSEGGLFSALAGKVSRDHCGPFMVGEMDFIPLASASFFENASINSRALFFGDQTRSVMFTFSQGTFAAQLFP